MSNDAFFRIGEAARLLAYQLGKRLGSDGHAHLQTARNRLLEAAQTGEFPIVAGTETWSGAASFSLPMECVHGLHAGNIDWDNSIFDASSDVPVEATAAIQHLHSGPATLWVPMEEFTATFGIQSETVGQFNRR